jgi:recombination protein RecT
MNESQAMVTIASTLASPDMQNQIAHMLPKNVPIDRFTEVTLMAIRQNPDVLQADRQTLYDSCLQLARRGLLPDKKEAALVVFNTNVGTYEKPQWVKQVQAMPMVEGIIKELGKAGVRAYAVSVYEKDDIRLWNDDDGQHVLHTPKMFGDRGARVGCFATGKTNEGRVYVEAMSMEDIAKVRSRSKQKDKQGNPTGTWKSDPERMEQKSALHRLRKRIPILDDAEALQNLKDFEEESDIELSPSQEGENSSRPEGGAPISDSESPPPISRRPRALQSVVDQTKEPAMEKLSNFVKEARENPDGEGYEGEDII